MKNARTRDFSSSAKYFLGHIGDNVTFLTRVMTYQLVTEPAIIVTSSSILEIDGKQAQNIF